MSSITKAELQLLLEASEAQVAELKAALDAAHAGEDSQRSRPHLSQFIWLQGTEPRRSGTDRKGQPYCFFSGQYARMDDQGKRTYGAYKDFSAFRGNAEAILAAYAAGNNLVFLECYEEPKEPREGDTRRFSDWNVVSVTVPPRPEAPEQLLEDPTGVDELDEACVPF